MRVKFLYPPRIYGVRELCTPPIHPHIVPLGLPMLVSYLRQGGFRADQDDLDIRNFHYGRTGSNRFLDLSPFLKKDRIKNAMKGKDDELLNIAERCLKMTRMKGYDAVGFSLIDQFNLPEIGTALLMAKILKERLGVFVMLGGTGISSIIHSDLIENSPFVDAIVQGTHTSAQNLLSILEEQDVSKETLEQRGLGSERISIEAIRQFQAAKKRRILCFLTQWRRNGRDCALILKGEDFSVNDFLPLPDFGGLPLDLYRFVPEDITSGQPHKMLILPYKYLVGCPFKCAFCSSSGQSLFAHKNQGAIVDDLEHLSRKYQTRFFFFLNSACNPSKGFTNELCDELIRRDLNLQWSDCADFRTMDADLLHNLKESGAKRLIFGLESGSERTQRYVNKNLNIGKAEKLLKISHGLGIWNEVEVIAGFPHEEWDDVRATERFLRKNRETIDYFYLNMFYLPKSSMMAYHPSRFRLTNVREDVHGEGLAFDEISRDSWDKLFQRKTKSFDHLFALREELYNTPYHGSEGTFLKLFYLYSIYGDKEKVTDYMKQCSYVYGFENQRGPMPAEYNYNTLYFKESHEQEAR